MNNAGMARHFIPLISRRHGRIVIMPLVLIGMRMIAELVRSTVTRRRRMTLCGKGIFFFLMIEVKDPPLGIL
jgi:hypothetical protein